MPPFYNMTWDFLSLYLAPVHKKPIAASSVSSPPRVTSLVSRTLIVPATTFTAVSPPKARRMSFQFHSSAVIVVRSPTKLHVHTNALSPRHPQNSRHPNTHLLPAHSSRARQSNGSDPGTGGNAADEAEIYREIESIIDCYLWRPGAAKSENEKRKAETVAEYFAEVPLDVEMKIKGFI
ncbi:hypothetical protein NUW58_g5772 [Xylaria curta]|uniref:Uncharacterized protein n=1 Tax=Xylaria curta TaxID=42375 RepID=A0ACC1P005_9PEZI|nr:hypothetical protein NUW58_g5772 [Xylaria curta]